MQHQNGELFVEPLANGLRRLRVSPRDPNFYVQRSEIVTAYPEWLIEQILENKGLAYICDEIARDEDPNYLELVKQLLCYFDESQLNGKHILDFGCGSGASTMQLYRRFPRSSIIGVELDSGALHIARSRASFYRFPKENLKQSPRGTELPSDLGMFDLVIMNAVYEHLVPNERDVILAKLWGLVKPGGHLFLCETPYRWNLVETHTTQLPLINYLPDKLTHWMACCFSKRVERNVSWETLLRLGIRGGSDSEILKRLQNGRNDIEFIEPSRNGVKDRVDLWLVGSRRPERLKRLVKAAVRAVRALTGKTFVPNLCLAFRKYSATEGTATGTRH